MIISEKFLPTLRRFHERMDDLARDEENEMHLYLLGYANALRAQIDILEAVAHEN